jgi:hypothetical protein
MIPVSNVLVVPRERLGVRCARSYGKNVKSRQATHTKEFQRLKHSPAAQLSLILDGGDLNGTSCMWRSGSTRDYAGRLEGVLCDVNALMPS